MNDSGGVFLSVRNIIWWEFTEAEKEVLIEKLTSELVILRARAKITQEETAKAIGVSRQTYSQIESGKSKMSWTMYMALLFFFFSMDSTNKLLDTLEILPV